MSLHYKIEEKKVFLYWGEDLIQQIDKTLIFQELSKLSKASSREQCLELLAEVEKKIAIRLAGKLLSGKAYLSHVLQAKLERRGLSVQACLEAVRWGVHHGFIKDTEQTERWIMQRLKKGYGLNLIAYEMQRQGMQSQVLIQKKDEFLKEEKKIATALYEKWKKHYEKDPKGRLKVLMKMRRRGFSI